MFSESSKATYKKEFKQKLTDIYNTVKDFQRIYIIGLRSGSIVCDYEVVCKGDVNLTILKTTTASVADPRNPLNFTFCKNCTATVNNTVLDQALTTAQNMRTSSACLNCKMGERCNVLKTFVRCYNPCKTTANGGCLNGGVCYFDGQENSTKCRCPSDEGRFVYSGEHCEIAVENLSLSSTYIAAIAGGTGGALIVVLSVVIICLILKRKKHNDVDKNGRQGIAYHDIF
ncbi:uncharacterized protein LOC128240419 [Mya arenaria]|uniref:uncharacterized protein LOC128240419 n=1 Tax=Mya arenaria TaxID=6604 RepID=UPI0022E98F14|nr:uncharacterized protein LOC128240419 [Mya arenaria]